MDSGLAGAAEARSSGVPTGSDGGVAVPSGGADPAAAAGQQQQQQQQQLDAEDARPLAELLTEQVEFAFSCSPFLTTAHHVAALT